MISLESMLMAAICVADMLLTAVLVSLGVAREANPLMAFFLRGGIASFFAAKLASFLPALVVAEWYRRRNPRLVRRTLRVTIAAYLLIYLTYLVAQ